MPAYRAKSSAKVKPLICSMELRALIGKQNSATVGIMATKAGAGACWKGLHLIVYVMTRPLENSIAF